MDDRCIIPYLLTTKVSQQQNKYKHDEEKQSLNCLKIEKLIVIFTPIKE